MHVSHSTFSWSLCFILHCLIASAGHSTKPGHIHLWIMHFVRGVVPFARVGYLCVCVCGGLPLGYLPGSAFIHGYWWNTYVEYFSTDSDITFRKWVMVYWDDLTWEVWVLSHLQHIRGTCSPLTHSQCIWQAGIKAEIVEHFLCLRAVTESAFHVPN